MLRYFGRSKIKKRRGESAVPVSTSSPDVSPQRRPVACGKFIPGTSIYEPDAESVVGFDLLKSQPDTHLAPINRDRDNSIRPCQNQQEYCVTEAQHESKHRYSGVQKDSVTALRNDEVESGSMRTMSTSNAGTGTATSVQEEVKITFDLVREVAINLTHPNFVKTSVIALFLYWRPYFVLSGFCWLFILCALHPPLRLPVKEALITGLVGAMAVVNGFAVTLIESIRISMRNLRQRQQERQAARSD